MSTLAQRSVLGRSGEALDQIHISGIAARGFHGVLTSEREAGQDFSADVTLYLDTRPAARGDDLTETVNYALVAQDIADILSGAPVNLIETVAEQIAAAVLARPAVVAVDVAVHKPQAPIPVPFADVVVAIHRDRSTVAVASPVEGAVADLTGLEADAAERESQAAQEELAPQDEQQAEPEVSEAAEPAEVIEVIEPVAASEQAQAPESIEPVETPQVRREPLPTAVMPVVISRPAEPEDDSIGSFAPRLDAPLDGPLTDPLDAPPMVPLVTHSDVLAAPLDAPAPVVPMSAAAFASDPVPTREAAATSEPAPAGDSAPWSADTTHTMPPVPFPSAGETHETETVEDETSAPSVAEPVDADSADSADSAPATPPLGIGLTAVLPPLDDEMLAEQARRSEQARRPEVFGIATLSTGWEPPLSTDSAQTPSVTAPEDFLTAEVIRLEDVHQDEPDDDAHIDPADPADDVDADAVETATESAAPVDATDDLVDDPEEPEAFTTESPETADEPHAPDTLTEMPVVSVEAFEPVPAPEDADIESFEAPVADEDHVVDDFAADEPHAPEDADIESFEAPVADEDHVVDEDVAIEQDAEDMNATAVLPRVTDRMDTVATEPVEVVIALGANLGDAQDTLRRAVADLASISALTITDVGPLARTAPVGGPDQPDFLNTIVLATTTLSPRELLHACQSIEAEHGRQRLEHWGPRTLDIDLIAYGALVYSADDLDIPHPRANERAFVLAPWAHLSPDAVLPGLGGGPVGALAATAPDRAGIRWLALDWLAEPEHASQPPASALPARGAQAGGRRADEPRVESYDESDDESAAVPPAPPL